MEIVDLTADNEGAVRQTAAMLVDAFPQAWPDLASALEEVREFFGAGRISRAMVEESGAVAGWIGGIEQYDGNVWELHPVVVRSDRRRQGVGRALVRDLEECVRERGACTLRLGTDDERGQTSLSGIDLYPDVWEHLRNIRNLREHPYEFYLKLGFVIVGVIPDANGPGKPDILMAKRVRN